MDILNKGDNDSHNNNNNNNNNNNTIKTIHVSKMEIGQCQGTVIIALITTIIRWKRLDFLWTGY